MRRLALLIALAGFVGQLGCSWAIIDRAPLRPARYGRVTCTTSTTAPLADLGGALAASILTVYELYKVANPDKSSAPPSSGEARNAGNKFPGVIWVSLSGALVAVFTSSALYGFRETSRCEEAEDRAARSMEVIAPIEHRGRP